MIKKVIVQTLATTYREYGKPSFKSILFSKRFRPEQRYTFNTLALDLADSYHVIALDLPGFGESEMPDKPWGLIDYANFVSEFCNKIHLEPNVVVGHSNGGSIAIKAVASNNLKPVKLVLLASAGIRENSIKKSAQKKAAHLVKPFIKILPKTNQDSIKQKIYKTIGSDLYTAEHMRETFKI